MARRKRKSHKKSPRKTSTAKKQIASAIKTLQSVKKKV